MHSDDNRASHDHPWDFVTLVLKGGYTDVSDYYDHLHVGSVRYRPATHKHWVNVDPGGCWTLLATGPVVRRWGFWSGTKFERANKYFLKYGDHPCD